MTREEAIARIKDHKIVHKMNEPRAIYISEALDMAIQALSQEPCDDMVSRDAALEKMADYVASGYADSAEDFLGYSRIICQLPSVTQKSAECDDVISRQYLLDNCVVDKATMPYVPVNKIENAPSVTQKCEKCAMNGSGSKYCDNCRQKSGKWIITPFSVTGRHYQCSECRYIHTFTNFEYCPKCGAKMESEE